MKKQNSIAYVVGVLLALLFTWIGLFIAFYLPYPVSFFITTLAFGTYVGVRFWIFAHHRFARLSTQTV
jgi:zinc/manganese transport system permease protein